MASARERVRGTLGWRGGEGGGMEKAERGGSGGVRGDLKAGTPMGRATVPYCAWEKAKAASHSVTISAVSPTH